MNEHIYTKTGNSSNHINTYYSGGLADCRERDNFKSSTISQQQVREDHPHGYPASHSCFRPYPILDLTGNPSRERNFGDSFSYRSSISSPGEKPPITSEYCMLNKHSSFVSSNANPRQFPDTINYESSFHHNINYDEECAHQMAIMHNRPFIRTDHISNQRNKSNITNYCERDVNLRPSTTSQQGIRTDHTYYPNGNDYFRQNSTFDQEGNHLRERDFGNSWTYPRSISSHPAEEPSETPKCSRLYNASNYVSSNANPGNFSTPTINYDSSPCTTNYNTANQTSMVGSSTSSTDHDNCDSSQVKNKALTRGILGGKYLDSFPEKLFQLLDDTFKEGKSDIVSFLPNGRAFMIYKPHKFMTDVVPNYFRLSKLTSFQRQLNMYGFKRIHSGRDTGAYYHMNFVRETPSSCTQIKLIKSKEVNSKQA